MYVDGCVQFNLAAFVTSNLQSNTSPLKQMLKCWEFFLQIFDFEHKEDLESGENKLYVLLERGESDLETIVEKLVRILV